MLDWNKKVGRLRLRGDNARGYLPARERIDGSQQRVILAVKEPHMPMSKCVRCGSESLAPGALHGPRRISFRPEGTKFLTLETGDVMTKVTMCRECGWIEITGDVEKLRRLTSET